MGVHGVQAFNILFDNPNGVYFAGQTVRGHVNLHIIGETNMTKGVTVQFTGGASVHWTERKTRTAAAHGRRRNSRNMLPDLPGDAGGRASGAAFPPGTAGQPLRPPGSRAGPGDAETTTTTEIVHHSNSESYFDMQIYVFGNGSKTYLAPGNHYFPFSFSLPDTIPSSFEGAHGHVRYSVRATVDRPWKFEHHAKAFFTVNNVLDLNRDLNATKPSSEMKHKHLCCLCCRSGPISAMVSVPKTGFVPGEKIVINAEVDNKSRRAMNGSEVQLVQRVTFHGDGQSKKESRKTIASGERGRVEPGDTCTWDNFELFVPSVPPSQLAYCSIMELEYLLMFTVSPKGIANDLVLKLPLTIGTVPLQSTFEQFAPPAAAAPAQLPQQPPAYSSQPAAPPAPAGPVGPAAGQQQLPYPPSEAAGGAAYPPQPSAPVWPVNEYPNLPPPTYEQSFFGGAQPLRTAEDNEHTQGNWEYVPRYVTYIPK